ncbi:carboxylesterase family protein [Mumia zhuanghuii]|uniref:Carboxylic ester hydrolase n=2 Tax=Mumia TaxID=1546255 RepID=A0ABW1QII5_9ACTN|nr:MULTISPECIES: carboxylesterase/lipase family protein [Mumia]KAA1424782.1 carboxylesterase family protein [Mumia zhuanghuii]
MQLSHRRRTLLRPALLAGALAAGVVAASLASPAEGMDRSRHDDTVVRTASGAVRGTVEPGLRTFEGIPYAAPPTGELRFRAPRPVTPWRGVLDASAPRQQCAQLTNGTGNTTTVDEDCLYLNVTTPAGRSARRAGLPVMVWIHGGSFLTGTGGSYDASRLATQGDVVVVTINYRLGPLGFLAHPALGSSNAALLDQQAALRWVQRNAAAFGGNPHNVTVFGESAGSASVCANVASPRARGLFRRAIAQSYSCASDFATREAAEETGERVAGAVGCDDSSDVAACLREVDVETLLRAWPGGAPVVGDDVLPHQPAEAIADGTANRVDLVHGNTLDENRLFIPLQYGTSLSAAQYTGAIGATFGPMAAGVLQRYPVAAYPSPIVALSTVFSDYGSPLSTCTHVSAYDLATARRGARVFAYQFQDRTADPLIPLLAGQDGAAHATELPFLFPGLFGDGLTAEQERLSDAMVAYWTSFAATGRPHGRGLPRWPAYEGPGDVLAFDLASNGGIAVEDVAEASHCGFWSVLD